MVNKYAHLAPRKPSVDNRRCVSKIRFPSQAGAQHEADRQLRRHGRVLRPYSCVLCLGWHLTKQPPREGTT